MTRTLMTALAATLLATLLATTAAQADPVPAPLVGEGVPVTVDLTGVEARPGALYISIQTEDEFQGIRGAGGIIEVVNPGMAEVTYRVAEPGTYAVSLWHDLDNDGVFSMSETYQVLDGWGGSGEVDATKRPGFADVAVEVPAYGATVPVTMFYPE